MDKKILRYLILFLASNSFSQKSDTLYLPTETENYVSLNYDNDFFNATDRYYTQGIILSFIHPIVKYSPLSYALVKLNKHSINYYGFHLEQDVFTPKSIRYKGGQIYYGERPFTAVFFISHCLSSLNPQKKLLLQTQLDIGIIGPYAKGEEEQKGIHKALDNIEPLGWENQLATDYILNYRTKIEKGLVNLNHFQFMVSANARLGSLYTDGGVGLTMRTGILNSYFSNLGLEKNRSRRKTKFKLYGIARANARLVGYNATLQGGLFGNKSVYTLSDNQIKRTVFDCMAGLVIAFKNVSLEYSKFYISPEFKTGVDHGWGKCVITVCF